MHRDFLSAYSGLSRGDQARVRATLDRLLADPSARGLRLHNVGPWLSISPSMSIRVLGVREGDGFCLVHVDAHDDAYRWAERHMPMIETDALVAVASGSVVDARSDGADYDPHVSERLCAAGIPSGISRALAAGDDDEKIALLEALAPEAQEAALLAMTGQQPAVISGPPSDIIVIDGDAALERALALPEAAWRIFLHPRQRFVVDVPDHQHLLVKGGPGVGKTIALVHRFVRLNNDATTRADKPPALMTLNQPMRTVLVDGLLALGADLTDSQVLSAEDLKQGLPQVLGDFSAVLIDEAQDMPVRLVGQILERLELAPGSVPPLTIAYDPNQSLSSPSGDALQRLAAHMGLDGRIELLLPVDLAVGQSCEREPR